MSSPLRRGRAVATSFDQRNSVPSIQIRRIWPRDRAAAKCPNSGDRLLGREVDAVHVIVDRGSADPELPHDISGPETVGPHPADLGDPRGIHGLAAFVPACSLYSSDTLDPPLALEVAFKLREYPEHGCSAENSE